MEIDPNSKCKGHLKQIKQELRSGNCAYLCRHPEVRAIARVFLHELIDKKPTNIYKFSASLFNCNNTPILITLINKQLNRVNEQIRRSQFSNYDADGIFSDSVSTQSLLSANSIPDEIDKMLRFALILRERNLTK